MLILRIQDQDSTSPQRLLNNDVRGYKLLDALIRAFLKCILERPLRLCSDTFGSTGSRRDVRVLDPDDRMIRACSSMGHGRHEAVRLKLRVMM